MIDKKLTIIIDGTVVLVGTIASIEHGNESIDDELEVFVDDHDGEGPFLVQFPLSKLR